MSTYNKFHEIDNNPETNSHLAEILNSIKSNGWQGLPLLAIGDQLLTGAHRATACNILDVVPVVHQMIIEEAKDEYEQYLIDQLADACGTDDLFHTIRSLHDEGLVDDYSLEIIDAEYKKEK